MRKLSAFFFDTTGTKKKSLAKKKCRLEQFALCGARPKALPLETTTF